MLGPALHITLALVFYSLGVWAERIARYLKPWHVVAFWTGFLFDLLGTWMMHRIAEGAFDITEPHTIYRSDRLRGYAGSCHLGNLCCEKGE